MLIFNAKGNPFGQLLMIIFSLIYGVISYSFSYYGEMITYTTNDIVLIILWTIATMSHISYLSVVICFIAFLFNDLYGFVNWLNIRKRQQNG